MRIRIQSFLRRFGYQLDGAGIDQCSERLEQELLALGVERQNRIRIRFSFEESLLRLRDRFGEKTPFDLIVRDRFGSSSVQIEVEGDIYNPLSKTDADPVLPLDAELRKLLLHALGAPVDPGAVQVIAEALEKWLKAYAHGQELLCSLKRGGQRMPRPAP